MSMKKVPSYPKITSKTNITVTHTQNININSPKGMAHIPSSKKLFKNAKSHPGRQQSQLRPSVSKLKTGIHKSTRRPSSGNLSKNKPIEDQQRPQNKHNIHKIEQKLKELQKKIDTLRHTKKRKEFSSKRSHSKNKQSHVTGTFADNKSSLSNFKKNAGSTQKILKKTQSDKYLIKPPHPPKKESPLSMTSAKQEEKQQKSLNKFVTQVARTETSHYKSSTKHNQKVVCYYIQSVVESAHKSYLQPFKKHLNESIQTLKYLRGNRKPSSKELERHSVSLPPPKHKYSLILDLDETLIHCNQNLSLPHDVTLKIKFPTGQVIDAGVNIRPYAKQFLKQLSQVCEVIVFTASHECYANVVLDHIDPKGKYVSHRLFRGQCWQTEEGVYVKDLRVLKNRKMQNILLVDNAAYSYLNQLENGIPIVPYYDDRDDKELTHLAEYAKQLIQEAESENQIARSLQQLNHKYFQLNTYINFEDAQHLSQKIYRGIVEKRRKMES